jgi:hypothetical protein
MVAISKLRFTTLEVTAQNFQIFLNGKKLACGFISATSARLVRRNPKASRVDSVAPNVELKQPLAGSKRADDQGARVLIFV